MSRGQKAASTLKPHIPNQMNIHLKVSGDHTNYYSIYIYIYILYNITFVPLAIKYVLKIYLIMLRLKMSKYKKYDKKH